MGVDCLELEISVVARPAVVSAALGLWEVVWAGISVELVVVETMVDTPDQVASLVGVLVMAAGSAGGVVAEVAGLEASDGDLEEVAAVDISW
mmetsp:Transcript_55514/g.91942  ORF Transcript_55514/g.91942 Transcript_55514/m.91942 type:complete len:92 (-) Transcript_55514:223-498(-)